MRILDACLQELKPFLREPLVGAKDVTKVAARAASVPESLQAFYLECRLSPPGPQVDFLGSVARRKGETEAAVAPEKREDPARHFLQRWRGGGGRTSKPGRLARDRRQPACGAAFQHPCVRRFILWTRERRIAGV